MKIVTAKLSDDDAEFLRTLLVQRRQMIRKNQATTVEGVLRQRNEHDAITRIEAAMSIADAPDDGSCRLPIKNDLDDY